MIIATWTSLLRTSVAIAAIAGLTTAATPALQVGGSVGLPIAFFSDRDGNLEIYVMASDGSRQTRLTNHPAEDRDPAWSPDGQWIAFISRRDNKDTEIFKMRPDGRDLTRLTNTPTSDSGAVWSPDGKRIAFVSEGQFNRDIFVMNADGTGVRNLTNHAAHDVLPSWSPDGLQIAFLSNRDDISRKDDAGEIYTVDVASGVQRAITKKRLAVQPSWLPGTNRLLFFAPDRGKGTLVFTVGADGGDPVVIGDSGSDHLPLGSPRGSFVAFQSSRHGSPGAVYVMKLDGSGATRISPGPEPVLGPSGWSPDERQVLYAAFQNNNWDIHAASMDGKSDRRLTENRALDMAAVWSPAAKR